MVKRYGRLYVVDSEGREIEDKVISSVLSLFSHENVPKKSENVELEINMKVIGENAEYRTKIELRREDLEKLIIHRVIESGRDVVEAALYDLVKKYLGKDCEEDVGIVKCVGCGRGVIRRELKALWKVYPEGESHRRIVTYIPNFSAPLEEAEKFYKSVKTPYALVAINEEGERRIEEEKKKILKSNENEKTKLEKVRKLDEYVKEHAFMVNLYVCTDCYEKINVEEMALREFEKQYGDLFKIVGREGVKVMRGIMWEFSYRKF